MTCWGIGRFRKSAGVWGLAVLLGTLAGCKEDDPNRVQGYVEGEFVYVAAPSAGALESLAVQRGTQVKAGDRLFVLDPLPERAARDEAERKLAMAKANWEDAKKGKRPSEIESLTAQLRQAQAAVALAESNLARQESLIATKATAAEDVDRARATRDQDRQRVTQLQADLETARLGSRSDQLVAAEANVRALEAALAKAKWDLSQKSQIARQAGLVYDTLFYQGEWVPAGRPVVALLPPGNIKVRAFVPETRIGSVQAGQQMRVSVDGVFEPFVGRVTYVSPQAEYTPPVIYSRESRTKLVFMIELRFDPQAAARLHPGQPVDVYLESENDGR
jgi:HlyD family secretion protein